MLFYSTHRKEQTLFGLKQDTSISRLWDLYDRCFEVIPSKRSKSAQLKHDAYIRRLKAATTRQMFAYQENEFLRAKLDNSINERIECEKSVHDYYFNRSSMMPIISSAFLLWFILWAPIARMM